MDIESISLRLEASSNCWSDSRESCLTHNLWNRGNHCMIPTRYIAIPQPRKEVMMNPLNKMIRRLHPGIYVTPLHVWAYICQPDASHAMAYPPFETNP